MEKRACSIKNCTASNHALSYCSKHYQRLKKHGSPTVVIRSRQHHSRGMRKHPMYSLYRGIIQRCEDPHHIRYEKYGGKGIKICDRWRNDFFKFVEDMGVRPDGKSIDRIDPSGDYEPSNCRWATSAEQAENRGIFRNNTSGKAGVSKSGNRWRSYINRGGKRVYLGSFTDINLAINARRQAERGFNHA